jgi:hypothetical protein
MPMTRKSLAACLALGASLLLAAALARPAFTETPEPPAQSVPGAPPAGAAPAPDFAANREAAASAIRKLVALSQAKLIYAEMRRCLREVFIPALKETAEGGFPATPDPTPETYIRLAKALTFLDYLDRASGPFEAAMAEHGDAMIEEAGAIAAQYGGADEVRLLEKLVKLPAVQKSFETIHAASRLISGFSLDDARAFAALKAWAYRLDLDASTFGAPSDNGPAGIPSAAKMAKAQALFADALRILRFDDMVHRLISFARDVYLPYIDLSPREKQGLLERLQEVEVAYNLKKAVALALAPVLIASSLTDEQLDTLRAFIETPAFAKLSSLYANLVLAATSFTPDDIQEAGSLRREAENALSEKKREAAEKAWNAYWDRWSKIISDAIPTDIREGLRKAWADLQTKGVPL